MPVKNEASAVRCWVASHSSAAQRPDGDARFRLRRHKPGLYHRSFRLADSNRLPPEPFSSAAVAPSKRLPEDFNAHVCTCYSCLGSFCLSDFGVLTRCRTRYSDWAGRRPHRRDRGQEGSPQECEELRKACLNKDELGEQGEQGEGNCRRFRETCKD